MKLRFVTISLVAAMTAGCVMPRAVASLGDVHAASDQRRITLVPVTTATIPQSLLVPASFPAEFLTAQPIDHELLGPGDVLKVQVWEGGVPTVFTTNSGDLGEVTVDDQGRLYVPFAGLMPVTGRSISEVRADITRRLRTVVRNPQVDIRPVRLRSKLISVQGNAAKAGSYPIERGRTRLGELLGEAAPDLKNPEMLEVTVRRGSQSGSVRMADVLRNPALDIALQPGDAIVLNEVVENVTVLGAAGMQGQVRIAKRDYSVADVLGEARGINEEAADPRAIFLVRPQQDNTAPTVYQFEMQRPETVALASRFVVHNKDAILISNAPFTQTRKALLTITQTLSTARSAAVVMAP
jgi:polysaccharide export outer membrane protein